VCTPVGLIRSLPCYPAFCLAIALTGPSLDLAAIALGLLACLAVARVTWQGVPIAQQRAVAQ
jgi:hypothetical protein